MLSFVEMDPLCKHLFTAIVVGPEEIKLCLHLGLLGKLKKLIPPTWKIVHYYDEFKPIFNDYTSATFIDGVPDLKQSDGEHRLC